MKLSEMINQLTKIKDAYGDMNMVLHDSSDGSDYIGMSVYRDRSDLELKESMPDECVIGFDSDHDIR